MADGRTQVDSLRNAIRDTDLVPGMRIWAAGEAAHPKLSVP
jgi:hypothetical protein